MLSANLRWQSVLMTQDGREYITSRIGPLFRNGLKIAGRKSNSLAYSQSAGKDVQDPSTLEVEVI